MNPGAGALRENKKQEKYHKTPDKITTIGNTESAFNLIAFNTLHFLGEIATGSNKEPSPSCSH